jgi:hypothetical protein
MSELSQTKRDRAFIASVQAELAGGTMQFDRETVRKLIGAYHAEAYRFDCLALDVAYDIELDDSFLSTNYREFTTTRNRVAEVDGFGMRDQIDRHEQQENAHG